MDDLFFSNLLSLPFFPSELRFGADDEEPPEDDDADDEEPPEDDDDGTSLDDWLKGQPEDVQKRFNAQRTTLKAVTQKERKLRRDALKKLRDAKKTTKKEEDTAANDELAKAKKEAADERIKREQVEAERDAEKLRRRFVRAVKKAGKVFASDKAEDLAFDAFDKDLAAEGDDEFQEAVEAVFEELDVLFGKEVDPDLENDGKHKGGPKINAAEEVAKRKRETEGSSYQAI